MNAAAGNIQCGVCGREVVTGICKGWGKMGVVTRTGLMLLRIGCGLGPGCRCDGRVRVSRGRGRHHHRQLADWRHKGDAGNGQKGGVVRRYFENGAEAEKGWRKRCRGVRYWPGKKGRGVVVWWVMEDAG